jgi:hypothetical protein
MTINFTMLAQNNENDYIKQAYLCALSIKHSNPDSKICLISNDNLNPKYKQVFDHIEQIPWGDSAKYSKWKIENRWKIYHVSPFERTAVIDTDMLILTDISSWKHYLDNKDVCFTKKVKTYKGNWVTSNYYRKLFAENNLPNLYSGFHYYKKSDFALEFFKLLEYVLKNWEHFTKTFSKITQYQKTPSIDVCAAIATVLLDCENKVTSSLDYPTFTHMKYHCQDWTEDFTTNSWQKKVGFYLNNDLELTIGNFKQQGIFHYTEKNLVTDDIISLYEKKLGI